jgi:alpha-L-fucosidase 2
LQHRAYPLLRRVAAYFEDFLFEDASGGLCVIPSNSPENEPANRPVRLGMNATIDVAVAREVLTHLIEAAEILGEDRDDLPRWQELLRGLPDLPIRRGMLAEWADASADENPANRHLSHLYPLFPGSAATPEAEPETVAAALAALGAREAGYREDACSFSHVWAGLVLARAGDGEEAYERLCRYARGFVMPNLLSDLGDRLQMGLGRRRRPGLSGHLFQVEAGLAASALIGEMLLQTHRGVTRLLPALPGAWGRGRATGLRGRGGIEVSMEWRDGLLLWAEIVAPRTLHTRLRPGPQGAGALVFGNDEGEREIDGRGCTVELRAGRNLLTRRTG